ncbi:MAG: response regulator [Bdellovibrionales bacterium]|nr:response regulator [Bdellovibrionales bacterium]
MDKKTILVIDDDFDLRETIAMALEAENYSVLTASNGKLALDLLGTKSPGEISCIVLDLMMPEMDGKEFLRRLHEDYRPFARIPVIIATAMGIPVQNIAIPYPVERIQKPMELDELYRALESAVTREGART